ncbi:phosphate ABC transporter substrate-binding protein [Bremerella cremea]|uniref:phosphate ABC transporter substrate-binding protein n=1 Tax=Bremerella cremea TaxID=1031537 RepID=UPI0031E85A79
MLRVLACFAVTCLLPLAGCGLGSSSTDDRITVTGSSTIAPLLTEIARRYEELHPGVRIDVQTGGTGKGIADVRQGVAEIGMASRELKSDESDLTVHPLAADGVGMIIHAENPIAELSDSQIVAIYRDDVNNWKDLGGPDLPIQVVHKAEGRATLEVFQKYFQIENTAVKPDVIVGHNEQGIKTVAGAPGAIGYVSIGTAEADIQAGLPIRLLPLAGVIASTATVADGTFPMSRPLHLVTKGEIDPVTADFIAFAQSDQVHDLITEQYFVPLAR